MTRLVKVRPRRRREGKTDYKSRMALLSGKIPRIVVRKTNKYIIAQIVESKEAQDFVKIHASSKELSKKGWKFSFKNLPAAYLTGMLIAKKALAIKVKKVILDIGRTTSTKGSKIYALLKGAVDAGLEINYSKDILPSEERISGKHIKKEEISKNFEEIKNKINK
jgi:large subunit ribosomal protein L18